MAVAAPDKCRQGVLARVAGLFPGVAQTIERSAVGREQHRVGWHEYQLIEWHVRRMRVVPVAPGFWYTQTPAVLQEGQIVVRPPEQEDFVWQRITSGQHGQVLQYYGVG